MQMKSESEYPTERMNMFGQWFYYKSLPSKMIPNAEEIEIKDVDTDKVVAVGHVRHEYEEVFVDFTDESIDVLSLSYPRTAKSIARRALDELFEAGFRRSPWLRKPPATRVASRG